MNLFANTATMLSLGGLIVGVFFIIFLVFKFLKRLWAMTDNGVQMSVHLRAVGENQEKMALRLATTLDRLSEFVRSMEGDQNYKINLMMKDISRLQGEQLTLWGYRVDKLDRMLILEEQIRILQGNFSNGSVK